MKKEILFSLIFLLLIPLVSAENTTNTTLNNYTTINITIPECPACVCPNITIPSLICNQTINVPACPSCPELNYSAFPKVEDFVEAIDNIMFLLLILSMSANIILFYLFKHARKKKVIKTNKEG